MASHERSNASKGPRKIEERKEVGKILRITYTTLRDLKEAKAAIISGQEKAKPFGSVCASCTVQRL
jgi:hypothetical protein